MEFELIASNVRLDGGKTILLPGRAGGRKCKVVQYWLVVVSASDITPTAMVIDALILHGPDGENYVTHTTVTGALTVDAAPKAANIDAGSGTIGEYTRLKLTGQSGSKWCIVNVYEMRKPY